MPIIPLKGLLVPTIQLYKYLQSCSDYVKELYKNVHSTFTQYTHMSTVFVCDNTVNEICNV